VRGLFFHLSPRLIYFYSCLELALYGFNSYFHSEKIAAKQWLQLVVDAIAQIPNTLHQLTIDNSMLPNITTALQFKPHLKIIEFFGHSAERADSCIYPSVEHVGIDVSHFFAGLDDGSNLRLTDFPGVRSLALLDISIFESSARLSLHTLQHLQCLDITSDSLKLVLQSLSTLEHLTALTLRLPVGSMPLSNLYENLLLDGCSTWNLVELRLFKLEPRNFIYGRPILTNACLQNPNLLFCNLCQPNLEPRRRHRLHWAAACLSLAFVRANTRGHPFAYSILPLVFQVIQLALGEETSSLSLFPPMLHKDDPLDTWHRPLFPMPPFLKLSDFLGTRFACNVVDLLTNKRKRRLSALRRQLG